MRSASCRSHPQAAQWSFGGPTADYASLVQQMHQSLYDLNVGADFVFPETKDFSAYKLLIVPALYIADDALLQAHLGLREERRARGDDVQERIRQ